MALNHGNFTAKTVAESVINTPNNTWTALPTTALADRNYIRVYNKGEHKLYLSFDNTVVVQYRYAIGGGEMIDFPVADNLTLYGRSGGAGSVRVIVQEFR